MLVDAASAVEKETSSCDRLNSFTLGHQKTRQTGGRLTGTRNVRKQRSTYSNLPSVPALLEFVSMPGVDGPARGYTSYMADETCSLLSLYRRGRWLDTTSDGPSAIQNDDAKLSFAAE